MNTTLLREDLTLRHIESHEVPSVAALLAQSFEDNPAYGYIFKTAPDLLGGLAWLFERNLRLHQKRQCTRVLVQRPASSRGTGRIVATLTWVPPGGADITTWDMVRQGLLLMPLRFGISSLRRLQYMMGVLDSVSTGLMQGQAHWYLSMVAVHSELRNQGLGAEMVRRHLEAVVDAPPARDDRGNTLPQGHPVALMTQRESNVRFYERLGFKVVSQTRLCQEPGSEGFLNWYMVREGRSLA